MPSFTNLLIIMAVGFAAPLTLGLFPGVRLPSVVLEIVAGIVIGPSVLGWAEVDRTVEVVAVLGLAFLLFLAGLEIDFGRLRGPVLRLTGVAFALSFVLAVAVAMGLKAAGLVQSPLLVAILLCATSLGSARGCCPSSPSRSPGWCCSVAGPPRDPTPSVSATPPSSPCDCGRVTRTVVARTDHGTRTPGGIPCQRSPRPRRPGARRCLA
jgi:hypothetical protein